jgi:hypothetical protein
MGTGYVCEGDMDTAHVKEAALLTSHYARHHSHLIDSGLAFFLAFLASD